MAFKRNAFKRKTIYHKQEIGFVDRLLLQWSAYGRSEILMILQEVYSLGL